MSYLKRSLIAIISVIILTLSVSACTDAEQYVFFVKLGDNYVESSEPISWAEAGKQLAHAKANWTIETATPAQHTVLAELSRQAQVRAFLEAVENQRRAIQAHPFLTCVRHHESDRGPYPHTNGYQAQNPYSTASGAYQFVDGTWRNVSARAGYSGYSTAAHAPWYVQDAVALWLYNNGGKSAWNGTGC